MPFDDAPSQDARIKASATPARARRPHVVVVGAGFGGLAAAAALARSPVDVTLIDRRNHHLFQPLLYQVATAGLAPTQIASPIRSVVRGADNTRVVLGEVTGIDPAAKTLMLGARSVAFDYLILATGATHAYFGHDEWAPFAPGLKTLDDAIDIRRRVLTAFEAAETACDPVERKRLLTFVIVGGGPTGVELAGAIAELARKALTTDFRAIRGEMARVLLVEAADRLLLAFDPPLSAYAKRAVQKLGVEVSLGKAVTLVDQDGVMIGDQRVEAANVIWAAGVRASSAGAWLGADLDRAGRVNVEPDLTIKGSPQIFVVGDLARHASAEGRLTPGVAPAAKQEGVYAVKAILADIAGQARPAPFRYADFGALATVGRAAAAVQLGRWRITGFAAWLFWCVAHIYFLVGFRNRIQVGLDWLWAYLTFERGSRLITGENRTALNAHLAGKCDCPTL